MRSTGMEERSKYVQKKFSFKKKTQFLFLDHEFCAKIAPIMNIKTPVAIKEMITDTKKQHVKNNI